MYVFRLTIKASRRCRAKMASFRKSQTACESNDLFASAKPLVLYQRQARTSLLDRRQKGPLQVGSGQPTADRLSEPRTSCNLTSAPKTRLTQRPPRMSLILKCPTSFLYSATFVSETLSKESSAPAVAPTALPLTRSRNPQMRQAGSQRNRPLNLHRSD